MTLHRWFDDDPAFLAAFNSWQLEAAATANARLLAGVQEAVDVVMSAVRAGNSALAYRLLKDQGFTKRGIPGPADAAEIQRRRDLRKIHE